jgi:hypothetical protein
MESFDICFAEKLNFFFISFRQKSSLFKVESWFLLHVKRWLKTTNEETPEWVRNAIKQDEVKYLMVSEDYA